MSLSIFNDSTAGYLACPSLEEPSNPTHTWDRISTITHPRQRYVNIYHKATLSILHGDSLSQGDSKYNIADPNTTVVVVVHLNHQTIAIGKRSRRSAYLLACPAFCHYIGQEWQLLDLNDAVIDGWLEGVGNCIANQNRNLEEKHKLSYM